MPLSAHETCSVPLRSKICAMFVMFAPASIDASAFGTHAIAKSTSPAASTSCGTMSTAPGMISTSRPRSSQ